MASVLLFINECSLRKSKAARRTAMVRDDMKTNEKAAFNTQVFLESAGAARKIVEFPRKVTIFTQGVPAKTVMYIQQGSVKLSVVNAVGKEAVLAILGPGDCLEKTVSQDSRFELEWLPRLHRPPCLRLKE